LRLYFFSFSLPITEADIGKGRGLLQPGERKIFLHGRRSGKGSSFSPVDNRTTALFPNLRGTLKQKKCSLHVAVRKKKEGRKILPSRGEERKDLSYSGNTIIISSRRVSSGEGKRGVFTGVKRGFTSTHARKKFGGS